MAEWALVVVGAVTLLAIWYQARETSRSAKASQKSVELQQTLHQQWIDVEHWKGDADFSADNKQVRLLIGFDVLNPTSMPLTLENIQATITSPRNTEKFEQAAKSTLTPKKAYAVTIVSILTVEEVSRLLEFGLQLTVSGSIKFTDAFEKKRTQSFAIACSYSARGASFTPWEGCIINEATHTAALPKLAEAKSRTQVYAHAAYDSALRLIDRAKSLKRFTK